MKRLTQTLPLILAALLQLLPLLRNIITNPATGSTMAFILRWGIGTGAAIGSVDAVSGASGTVMNTSSNITGTVGVYMTNNANFLINGGNKADPTADFLILGYKVGAVTNSSVPVFNNSSTSFALPPGLSMKMVAISGAPNVYGVLTGTPTTAITTNIIITVSDGAHPYSTNLHIVILPSVTPPSITTQPITGVTNLVGSSSSAISVVASGTAPLSYQWYFNTNTAVVNATNAALTLTNIQLSNAGYYRCTITNTAGSTNSANTLLTVWQAPTNLVQPTSASIVAGGNASFSATASGTPAVAYQWFFGNSAISGATSSGYNLSNVRVSQAGNYTIVITNAAGAITSSPAALTVNLPASPLITSPANGVGGFQFTFVPIVGLTNTVQANGALSSGAWSTLTNVPPPANASPVTIIDGLTSSNRFYRVMIQP